MDETGNTGSRLDDREQKYHYVGALFVSEACWQVLVSDLRAIAIRAIGVGAVEQPKFEFHGHQLWGGSGPWHGIEFDSRIAVYEECLELLKKHEIVLAYGRCNKTLLQRYKTPRHPHEIAFWLCLEQTAHHLNRSKSLGFIVADDASRDLKKIARAGLEDYRNVGPPFGRAVDNLAS